MSALSLIFSVVALVLSAINLEIKLRSPWLSDFDRALCLWLLGFCLAFLLACIGLLAVTL